MRFMEAQAPTLVGMESCCGAHHLGRALIALGHDARLMPPQFVKPFVKSKASAVTTTMTRMMSASTGP